MPDQRNMRVGDGAQQPLPSSPRGSCLKWECTLAITRSICASTSSERSSVPSARMSTSMPAKMRMPSIWPLAARIRADMFQRAPVVQAVGKGQILGMLGDGHVLISAFARGLGHLFQRAAAVGFHRVHVHVAPNIARR